MPMMMMKHPTETTEKFFRIYVESRKVTLHSLSSGNSQKSWYSEFWADSLLANGMSAGQTPGRWLRNSRCVSRTFAAFQVPASNETRELPIQWFKVQNYRWGNAAFRFWPLTMVVCLSLAL